MTLRERLDDLCRRALARGALVPLETEQVIVEQEGLQFAIRRLSTLARKPRRDAARDPFSPPDPELVLGDVSPTHVAVLNKFPVVAAHLLIVTKDFEEQDALLTAADLEALWPALLELDGLGFYNAGALAGASQAHKHLQLVPLPLAPELDLPTPIEPAVRAGRLPFAGELLPFDPDPRRAHTRYLEAHARIGGGPYNYLATRRWAMIVPRKQERWQGVSVNALGFAGSLLVKTREDLARVRDAGPLTVLRSVAGR